MGKNQAYKAMQKARLGSGSGGPDEAADDGMIDGSFHSPEWHAARLASLKTSHTVTWEEYKKKQKEDELKRGELEADKDKMMQEYRAQLDAERASKLAHGRNHSSSKSSHKKDRKEKDLKKRSSSSSSKKRKRSRRRLSDSSSSSESDSSSSEDEERESRRSKSRSKRSKKEKRHRSRKKESSESEEESDGPLPLSKFFGNGKS